MSKDLTKRAVDLLLQGATLVSDPCPYCKGVRVMKNGSALCVSCGKEAADQKTEVVQETKSQGDVVENLNKKILELTAELQKEKDHEKQKQILRTINDIVDTRDRLGRI